MRIDSNYLSATASSSSEQQRVRSNLREIEPQGELDAGPVQQGGATARVSATAAASRTAQTSDTADISGTATSMSSLAAAVHSSPDVRQAKVEALRDAVAQGTYQVSPGRIADSMLAQATSKLR
jgi:negative regulator of flagellin synthesis FlgM